MSEQSLGLDYLAEAAGRFISPETSHPRVNDLGYPSSVFSALLMDREHSRLRNAANNPRDRAHRVSPDQYNAYAASIPEDPPAPSLPAGRVLLALTVGSAHVVETASFDWFRREP